MTRFQQGRHTSAFILLLLNDGPAYGGQLLSRLDDELPWNPIDSPSLYRTLKQLEEAGDVTSEWVQAGDDRPVKWYRLTETGRSTLQAFHEDIRLRAMNLRYFLDKYEQQKEDPE
ncbi:PadR family transcriptional regulator [Salisediminibacterium beveridgei]|uniref:Transcriptional regulator, PadR family n=1 Tax=Salisediminibacterium beveridgei TaxID=632773 RepID=A0A1D7QS00_9BACI|nr:PadR family transcriptional regulator [Salisediminibacterium beveridgei]AOM81792.1 Transcriptional regulator, PadR family [Salisediminibacterium beveridgei]